MTDIFDLQDELSAAIASTAAARLEQDLTKRAALKPTSNLSAYECVLRGRDLVHRYTEAAFAEARSFFENAISLDPGFARAYGWLAYLEAYSCIYWQMSLESSHRAIAIGEQGLRLDEHETRCHVALGVAHLFRFEHDKAGYHLDRATTLNPNDDLAMIEMGRYKQYVNEPEAGATFVRRAMRQNPYHPNWYWNILARCLHVAGDYRGAIAALENIEAIPYWGHAYLAACHSQVGDKEQAARHVEMTLLLKPDFTLRQFEGMFPYRDPATRKDFLRTLRDAGLP